MAEEDTTPQSGPNSDEVPIGAAGLPRSVGAALEILRNRLLEIGKRNRLINTPLKNKRAKQLIVVDELSDETFRLLYRENRRMSFLPVAEDSPEEETELNLRESDAPASGIEDPVYVPPEVEELGEDGRAARHVDDFLQSSLTPEKLQKRLLGLSLDARSLEEEQGVSVLYLALGFLHWYEDDRSDIERFAPLLLLPVNLERSSVQGRFYLSIREQDLEPNLSLRAMLETDFGIKLPDLPETDEWVPSQYFEDLRQSISHKKRWQVVDDDIVLGFYSFAKFLMWRDLDPGAWPEGSGPHNNELMNRLLTEGFGNVPPLFSGEENLDKVFVNPRELGHIMDADASQTQVIAAACDGRNLVVQGPPGTGKSQTIANVIATAVRDGKRVLFVAEKMAALNVVHDRLSACGLGDLCLEIHSRMANKRAVLEELKRTLNAGRPVGIRAEMFETVRELRDKLNHISELLHTLDPISGQTPYLVIGRLALLREQGIRPPDFELPESAEWASRHIEDARSAVSSLADLTERYGPELEHPWRGVNNRLSPMDRDRLMTLLDGAVTALDELLDCSGDAFQMASMTANATPTNIAIAIDHLDALESMPDEAPGHASNPSVLEQPRRAIDLVQEIKAIQDLKDVLGKEVVDNALAMEWADTRASIAAYGKSLFRIFNGRFREALARLRSVAKNTIPKVHDERLQLLDALLEHSARIARLEKETSFGEALFGEKWRQDQTEVREHIDALEWLAGEIDRLGSGDALSKMVENLSPESDPGAAKANLVKAIAAWETHWTALKNTLDLDGLLAFGIDDESEIDWSDVRQRLSEWRQTGERLEEWGRLAALTALCDDLGVGVIREKLGSRAIEPSDALPLLDFSWSEALWKRLCKETPALTDLDGDDRSRTAETFRNIDAQLKELAAQELARLHHDRLPRGSAGQMGLVKSEIAKKRRHMALRKLMDHAGEAIAEVKPVFLMSPLSVAQYLKPGGLSFDILVIDEASQIRPEDAIGAIMRSSQVVVVGDRKQLPPTSFFNRQVDGPSLDDEDEDDTELELTIAKQIGDMESILTLCDARSMPGEVLKWHYRSKHPSLIEVSNHSFYEDRLIYPPSPDFRAENSGLTLTLVEGVYDRGRTRKNAIEADAVASAVLEHARNFPNLSLGVVTLSISQRDAILNRLEFLRASHPELESFYGEEKRERFFVKSLENVQGDERDVIFISVGYGRDENGYMSQGFGPVSAEGGERRLNVLFTRAKLRCQVFSSITHRDIRADAIRHQGPIILQRFLKYAEIGELDVPTITGGPMDSPFEESVAAAIVRAGFDVEAQVGSAGFRIDLGVYDPERPGHFILGIECDGAAYHSSRWARERDRLRQVVLEQKGWTIHRVWSTDWFQKPETEMQKILEAIDKCRRAAKEASRQAPPPKIVIDRELVSGSDDSKSVPYREAEFEIPERSQIELHEAKPGKLRQLLERIATDEGPIHIEEIGRRLSRLWGYKRAGGRIQTMVEEQISSLIKQGRIEPCPLGGPRFIDIPGRTSKIEIRDRSSVASNSLKKPEFIPPAEIRAAILQVVEDSIAVGMDDCAVEVARLFGFKSTSAEIKSGVCKVARKLEGRGEIEINDGELRLAQ